MQKIKQKCFNPIPMGLIFDYFLSGGGEASNAPPLKSALIELEKTEITVLESSQKLLGVFYILKISKNAIYLAKMR